MDRQPQCRHCETALTPIHLLDQKGKGRVAVGFAYTLEEPPKVGMFSGQIKNRAGIIHAFLCPDCGQVFLFAFPDDEQVPEA